jgi:hypothetical protein
MKMHEVTVNDRIKARSKTRKSVRVAEMVFVFNEIEKKILEKVNGMTSEGIRVVLAKFFW